MGVLVGVASLQQVSMAKRSGGRELGKGEGQAMSVGFRRIHQDLVGFSRSQQDFRRIEHESVGLS